MNQKDLFRNLLIAGAIVIAVMFIAPKMFQLPPERQGTLPGGPTDIAPAATSGTSPSQPAATPGQPPSPIGSSEADGVYQVVEAGTEITRSFGAPLPAMSPEDRTLKPPDGPYRMRLTVSNIGASVESALMADHWASHDGVELYPLLMPGEGELGGAPLTVRSLAIEKINIDGLYDVGLSRARWHVVPESGVIEGDDGSRSIEFWVEIQQAGEPVLRLTRTFTLPSQTRQSGRSDLACDLVVENLSDTEHQVVISYRGGVGIRTAHYRLDDRYVDIGVDSDGRVTGHRAEQANVAKSPDLTFRVFDLGAERGDRLAWAATDNTYFSCTVAPQRRDGSGRAYYISAVDAVDVDGLAHTDGDRTVRFASTLETLAPGGSLSYPADVYIGPKSVDAFKAVEPYKSRNYYYQISQGFGACTFTVLVELMIWMLNSLYLLVGNFGVAIIILVLIVRALLHPITKKGQVNMVKMQQRMGEMAPKIEEIKRKYANDKARMNQEMMKLDINPAGQILTCLPMFIQMPIWIALWISLSNNLLMRHQPFMWWITDLSAPDALYTFASSLYVPLLGWEIASFNLLPILLSMSMYVQQKMMPKPKPNPNQTEQQRQQQQMMQKMMPMMSVMMLVLFYNAPSGLTLYIMCSNVFGTIEQWRIRKHIREQEAAGTLHKPKRKKPDDVGGMADKPRKPSLIKRLQQMAEDANKQQIKRPKR